MNAITKRKRVSGTIINLPTNEGRAITGDQLAAHGAERAIVGAVLREPSVFASTSEVLQPADFYNLFYGYCWYAFEQIVNRGEEIDLVTLADELDRCGKWNGDTDMARLTDMITEAPSASNAEAYARQVREAATRLRVLAALDSMREQMVDRQIPIDRGIDECNRLLFEATDQQLHDNDSSMAAVMAEYFGLVEEGYNAGVSPGLPTGYKKLDELHGGAARGEVVVIGGGEGMGKTTFSLCIARAAALLGLRVAIFTLEMTKIEIARIFTTIETGIPKITLKKFDFSQHQWSLFVQASERIRQWGIHIIDEYTALTPIQLRRRLRKMMLETGVDIVLIDGLWLMEDSSGEPDRPRAVGNIMRDLNEIARDFNVALYITHQYNAQPHERGKDDKRPKMHDFAESAGVRRNAQVMWGLYRDSYYGIESPVDLTELHILKDRNGSGAQGKAVEFTFDVSRSLFKEA
jgi:replicative DNA helicase